MEELHSPEKALGKKFSPLFMCSVVPDLISLTMKIVFHTKIINKLSHYIIKGENSTNFFSKIYFAWQEKFVSLILIV